MATVVILLWWRLSIPADRAETASQPLVSGVATESSRSLSKSSSAQGPARSHIAQSKTPDALSQFAEGSVLLLDGSGKLTSVAMSALSLSEAEIIAMQELISLHRQKLSQEAQKRLEVDHVRTSDTESAFIMKAFPERGLEIKQAMMDQVTALLGDRRGRAFARMFPRLNYGGDFGSLEIQIKTKASEVADAASGIGVTYEAINPETGLPYGGGSFPLSTIEQCLGVRLEIQE